MSGRLPGHPSGPGVRCERFWSVCWTSERTPRLDARLSGQATGRHRVDTLNGRPGRDRPRRGRDPAPVRVRPMPPPGGTARGGWAACGRSTLPPGTGRVVPSSTGRAFRPSRGDARRAGALSRWPVSAWAVRGAAGWRHYRRQGAHVGARQAPAALVLGRRECRPQRPTSGLLGRVRAHTSGHLGRRGGTPRVDGWPGGRDGRPERRRVSIAPDTRMDTRVDTLGRPQAPAWGGRGLLLEG